MRFRLEEGGRIDRAQRLRFSFNGRGYEGYAGDTLASALIANGTHLTSRSFKYHRPRGHPHRRRRGAVRAGAARRGRAHRANLRATQWSFMKDSPPSASTLGRARTATSAAWTGKLAPLFPAGFYYKTFLWPASFWKLLYEPVIRRMAGLGRAPEAPDPDSYDKMHIHCDVLVVGGGPAGISAALAAGEAARASCSWTNKRRSAVRCSDFVTGSTARTARPGPKQRRNGWPPCQRCACSPARRSSATTTTTR